MLTALGERNATEQRAALQAMITDESLTVSETLQRGAGALSHREAAQLRRLTAHPQADVPGAAPEVLFQVLTEREETNAVGHRQQRELQRLDQDLHRPRLCAAIVDRLTFAGNIIETGTVSYRLAHARAQRTAAR